MKKVFGLGLALLFFVAFAGSAQEIASAPAAQPVAAAPKTAAQPASAAPVDPSAVSEGKTVKFEYSLKVDGKLVESSEGKTPLEYVQGKKMIVPGLEKALAGMKAGESKHVLVKADEGYGPVVPEMVMDLPKTKLAEGVVAKKDMMLQFPTKDGGMIIGKVVDVMDKDIKVDFNHPLAGKDLTFEIQLMQIN